MRKASASFARFELLVVIAFLAIVVVVGHSAFSFLKAEGSVGAPGTERRLGPRK